MECNTKLATWGKRVLGLCLVGLLVACASGQSIRSAINAYDAVAGAVKLGQTKEQVLALLGPTQSELPARHAKPHEEYMQDGKLKEVYFFRSRSFADGLVTDDEFTPYIFEDGILVAIGWTAIGGPKTQAQQREQDVYYHYRGHLHY